MSKINSSTRMVGVIGWPIHHSLSPLMQNAAIEALGLNWVYTAMAVEPARVPEAVAGARALGFAGLNVTIPHKEAVLPLLDELAEDARAIGAVNTIHFDGGHAIGHNTDAEGFTRTLAEEAGFNLAGQTMLQLGAGGAGRAMLAGAALAGARRVLIYDIRAEAAAELARQMAAQLPACQFEAVAGEGALPAAAAAAALIANATPLGMKPEDPLPLDGRLLESRHVVFDAVYNPYRTALIAAAEDQGARTVSGLGMLARQGWKSLSIWTGMIPDEQLMLRTLRQALGI